MVKTVSNRGIKLPFCTPAMPAWLLQAHLLMHSWLSVSNSFGTTSPLQCAGNSISASEAEDTSCDVLWTLETGVVEKTDTFSWRSVEKLMLLSVGVSEGLVTPSV